MIFSSNRGGFYSNARPHISLMLEFLPWKNKGYLISSHLISSHQSDVI